jgi:ribosome-interacting GTPase 1
LYSWSISLQRSQNAIIRYHFTISFNEKDLPGIIEGAKDNLGKGKQVIAVARTCNLILIVLDATRPAMHKRLLEHELEGFGIRMNKKKPAIEIRKKEKGGIDIIEVVKQTQMNKDTIISILKEYR